MSRNLQIMSIPLAGNNRGVILQMIFLFNLLKKMLQTKKKSINTSIISVCLRFIYLDFTAKEGN